MTALHLLEKKIGKKIFWILYYTLNIFLKVIGISCIKLYRHDAASLVSVWFNGIAVPYADLALFDDNQNHWDDCQQLENDID